MENNKKIIDKYSILSFFCGGICMILELIAARVMSPHVGSSQYIWTAIIGVMLICMSFGYYLGGKISDKTQDTDKLLYRILLISTISVILVSVLETVFFEFFMTYITKDIATVALIGSTVIFGVPSATLSMVSPIIVKHKANTTDTVGKVSGSVSSLSTLGSITGTFLGGFVLIPTTGVRLLILILSIALLFISVMFSKINVKRILLSIVLLVSIISVYFLSGMLYEKMNPDIIREVDSEYSRIFIKEKELDGQKIKVMEVDTAQESLINMETGEMEAEYLQYFDLFDTFDYEANSIMMIGGAAYTYPIHFMKKFPEKDMTVVEIDKIMPQLAQEEFGLDVDNENLHLVCADGRSYLNQTEEKFDCVLIDAFKGYNAPFELTTYEAMQSAYNALNDKGIVITNILSSLTGENNKFVQYEYATYKKVFDEVLLFKVNPTKESQTQNLILVGIKGDLNLKENHSYQEFLEAEVKNYSYDENKIATDDYCPIGN